MRGEASARETRSVMTSVTGRRPSETSLDSSGEVGVVEAAGGATRRGAAIFPPRRRKPQYGGRGHRRQRRGIPHDLCPSARPSRQIDRSQPKRPVDQSREKQVPDGRHTLSTSRISEIPHSGVCALAAQTERCFH